MTLPGFGFDSLTDCDVKQWNIIIYKAIIAITIIVQLALLC